jgi:DHA1 family multidrug resistance protein-like MFS transporter
MVQDIIRDSTVGQIVNYLSGGRFLPYPEQRSGYVVPTHFLLPSSERKNLDAAASDTTTLCGDVQASTPNKRDSASTLTGDVELQKKQVDFATALPDPYLVGWNGDSDPENPRCVAAEKCEN